MVLAWEIAGRTLGGLLFPSASATIGALVHEVLTGALFGPFLASNAAFVVGFLIAAAGGILLGLLMAISRGADRWLGPYLQMLMVTPVIALVPLVLVVFGLTLAARVFIVVMFALPQVALNTRAGVRSVERDLVEMALCYGGQRAFLWRHVLLPGALPAIVAGLWLAIGRGISGMIVAELTIVGVGLGSLMRNYTDSLDSPNLVAVTMVLILEGLVLTYLVRRLARPLMPHRVGTL